MSSTVLPGWFVAHVCVISCVQLFGTLWAIAPQAPLSLGFSRQQYQSGLPCPSPGYLPDPRIKPTSLTSPALAGRFFTTGTTWEAQVTCKQWWKNLFRGLWRQMDSKTNMRTLFNKLPQPFVFHLCTVNNKRVPENVWKVLGIQAWHVVRAWYFYGYFPLTW